jgi:hypothetical protein
MIIILTENASRWIISGPCWYNFNFFHGRISNQLMLDLKLLPLLLTKVFICITFHDYLCLFCSFIELCASVTHSFTHVYFPVQQQLEQ